MTAEVETQGFRELDRALRKHPPELVRRDLRRAVAFALVPVRRQARDHLANHRRTGALHRGLRIRTFLLTRRREAVAELSTSTDTFYGRMLEFGTLHITPIRWLTRATEARKAEVFERLQRRLWQAIRRAAEKHGRRGPR